MGKTTEKLGSGTVLSEKPGSGTVLSEKLGSGTVFSEKPGSGTANAEEPGSGTAHSEELGSGTIHSEKPVELLKTHEPQIRCIYKEAFDGARRAEEFKFRVKFDNLLVELHQAIQDKNPDGLNSCFTSPSYGEVMLIFRGKVKDILKSFTQRLTLAHESFNPNVTLEDTVQKVKQDVSKFIEDLIGETLDLTSDEAVSDLSSLSDESTNDQNSYEDLIAQAVVTKLVENHRREVSGSLDATDSNGRYIIRNQNFPVAQEGFSHNSSISNRNIHRSDILVDSHHTLEEQISPGRNTDLYKSDSGIDEKIISDNFKKSVDTNKYSGEIISTDKSFSETCEEPENNNEDDEIDIEKDFEELKEFVRKTQSGVRPKVEALEVDDAKLCEVREEELAQSKIDHDENREEFLTRYNVFDKVHNIETDYSQFDKIDFTSNEIDPDLLSMNLEIIPEETEEELEKEEDEDRKWRSNWIFKGTNGVQNETAGRQVNKTFTRPEITYIPQIGSRNVGYMSEPDIFSPSDLDGSDDEENTYYANTSKEIARISSQRNKYRTGNTSDDSDYSAKLRSPLKLYDENSQDFADSSLSHMVGPIVAPSKQEMKFLQDLIPADSDDPKFVIPPESVTIQEGEPVKFSCKVTGTPPIDVFWYREGDEVEEFEDSEDVEISSNGDKHSITLYNVSKTMAGQYMCIALNEKGKATQYLIVTVKSNKHEFKKPEFIKGLKDVEVTEGQSVKFRVKVKGYPPPRINWYKDGTLLKTSKSCRLEKFGNRDYILTIDYATMNDDAEYTVCARNVAGEVKLSAQVIVEPQSDLPVKKQKNPSMTTSGASDSDSDRSSVKSRSRLIGSEFSSPLSDPVAAARQSVYEQENRPLLNHVDQKISLLQKKYDKESQNLKEDAKKDQSEKSSRLLSPEALHILETAEEIIQQEKASENLSLTRQPDSHDSHMQAVVEELNLPDSLDDFPLSSQETFTQAPVKSTFELVINKTKPDSATSPSAALSSSSFARKINEPKSDSYTKILVSNGDHLTKLVPHNLPAMRDFNQNDTNLINTSFDSGKGVSLQDISTSLASSFSSNSSSRDNIESDLELARNLSVNISYNRDFEVHQPTEKKKWSVQLNPFTPQADIVHIEKPTIEVSNVDDSYTSIKADSQASSPRQSIDSGVSVSSKLERPAPVHMIGQTSEDEVPESRTEFNTDGSIELPSVNRLRALFSNTKDDDMGDGNFKRVHSITARSVPKDKLEKLRASNQKSTLSSSTPNLLCVPGEPSKVSSTATLKLGSLPEPVSSAPPPQTSQHHLDASTYIDVKADKEPVLIYPEMETTSTQLQQQLQSSKKMVKAPEPPQNTNPVSQSKLLIHTTASSADELIPKNRPRIKSGCISARTAFWERKMIDGNSVNDNEFPEMLEDGDS
ncbi:hypothetical protein Btru_007408 [Bulinus truncatus]|nr:hypothetical protein Btru_007408 [Bulinus truncatus]